MVLDICFGFMFNFSFRSWLLLRQFFLGYFVVFVCFAWDFPCFTRLFLRFAFRNIVSRIFKILLKYLAFPQKKGKDYV